jgi:hypothetical protein
MHTQNTHARTHTHTHINTHTHTHACIGALDPRRQERLSRLREILEKQVWLLWQATGLLIFTVFFV